MTATAVLCSRPGDLDGDRCRFKASRHRVHRRERGWSRRAAKEATPEEELDRPERKALLSPLSSFSAKRTQCVAGDEASLMKRRPRDNREALSNPALVCWIIPVELFDLGQLSRVLAKPLQRSHPLGQDDAVIRFLPVDGRRIDDHVAFSLLALTIDI